MNTLRTKAIVLSIVFTMCVLAMPLTRVKADSFPSTFYVNNDTFYDAAAIFGAYTQLNSDQREIASYLLGMYNLFYLGARGFQFSAGAYSNESEFIAKIKSFGYRLFEGSDGTALRSRFDENFCKYASAVLLYASRCNVTFSTWFENLDEDFVIPVDQGILNSFTLMYNDNSDIGISSFGDVQTPWESGIAYDFGLNNYPWSNTDTSNRFYDFIHSYSYIMYTNVGQYYDGSPQQFAIGINVISSLPDALYLQKDTNYQSFRYGYSDGRTPSSFNLPVIGVRWQSNGTIYCNYFGSGTNFFVDLGIRSTSTFSYDLSDRIEEVFYLTPFIGMNSFNTNDTLRGFYPLVKHVYLVDDLNTLANPVEVFNTSSWDIVGMDKNMIVPIDTVHLKPKVLTTINLPDNSHNPVEIQDIINDDNVVDDNGDSVDPWQLNVVVQPNETNPISIDVNLFSSGKIYLEYLWEHTKKIAQFTKDILNCFEFDAGDGSTYGPKYAIYGVLVLGMAGGMIAKFLL